MTDVAAVTGFPEMLDGRIKTLHPRVHGGLLADRRLADHRRSWSRPDRAVRARRREPLPVRGGCCATRDRARRARRGDRHRRPVDGAGGGEEPRQCRDRHRSGALRAGAGGPAARRRSRWACARRSPRTPSATRPRTTRGSPPSCRRGWRRPGSSCPTSPVCPAPRPVSADDHDRAGEGRDASLRGEPAPARGALPAPAAGRRTARSPRPRRRSRARPCRSTTSSMPRRPTRSAGTPRAGRGDRRAHEPVWRRRAADAARGVACSPRSGSRSRRSVASSR